MLVSLRAKATNATCKYMCRVIHLAAAFFGHFVSCCHTAQILTPDSLKPDHLWSCAHFIHLNLHAVPFRNTRVTDSRNTRMVMGVPWPAAMLLLGSLHCSTSLELVAGMKFHGGSGESASTGPQAVASRAHDLDGLLVASTPSDPSAVGDSGPLSDGTVTSTSGRTLLHGCHGNKRRVKKRCVLLFEYSCCSAVCTGARIRSSVGRSTSNFKNTFPLPGELGSSCYN